MRFITGLWSPSFLLTRKRLLIYSFLGWDTLNRFFPQHSMYFFPNQSTFYLIYFLSDVGVNFDLIDNFENWSSRSETIAEFVDFFTKYSSFPAEGYSWMLEFLIFEQPFYSRIHLCIWNYVGKVLLSCFLRGSVEARSIYRWGKGHFLPLKPQKLLPSFLKLPSSLFVKMAVHPMPVHPAGSPQTLLLLPMSTIL